MLQEIRRLCGGFRFSSKVWAPLFFPVSAAGRQCTIHYPRYAHTFCPRKRGRAKKRVSQQLIAMCPEQSRAGGVASFRAKKQCNVFIRAAPSRFCARAEFHGNQIKRPCPFQSARSEFERKLATGGYPHPPSGASQTKLFHARTEALARNAHFAKVIARKNQRNCRCFSILPSGTMNSAE